MRRRTLLGTLGAAALAAPVAMAPRAGRAAASAFDPANRDHILAAYRKLAFTADASVTYVWLRATRFGLVDTQFTPFWEMHVGRMFTVADVAPGVFEVTSISAIFYTDVETGKYLETFKNPYTGKTVPVRYAPSRVGKTRYDRNGEERHAVERPGFNVTTSASLGPAWVQGDNVWLRADTNLKAIPAEAGKGRPQHVNDWSTYHGSLAQVTDPDVKNPPSTWIFNDINTWPEWLEMGDQPGNYVSRGIGHKAFAFDEMPDTWKMLMRQRNPDIARDPAGALKG